MNLYLHLKTQIILRIISIYTYTVPKAIYKLKSKQYEDAFYYKVYFMLIDSMIIFIKEKENKFRVVRVVL